MPDHATPFRILTYADKQFQECGFGMIAFIATLGREPGAGPGDIQCANYFNPAVSESMRDTVAILIIETVLSDVRIYSQPLAYMVAGPLAIVTVLLTKFPRRI